MRYALWAIALLIIVVASVVFPSWGATYFSRLEKFLTGIARRKRLAILICGLLVLLLRAVELPRLPIHEPDIHDEFSYLLQADTFSSGRLTNPTPPLWQHFESFHIFFQPTYMSMHPAAQGMTLAAGRLLGHPWIGVYLSMGIFCAALCWMLQGWLPPGWAFLGAMLIVMRIGVLSYWMNSYWGGAVAGIGGALVLGALPRIMRHQRIRDALLMAFGLIILANSRPYEGAILSIPVAAALLVWVLKKHVPLSVSLPRVVFPLSVVLILGFSAMGYFFWRVTGSPFRLPYQLARETYAVSPHFLWQAQNPTPVYRHEVMRKFYLEWEPQLQHAQEQRTLRGWRRGAIEKVRTTWSFFLGIFLTIPFLMLPWVLRDRRMRFWIFAALFILMGLAVQRYILMHYLAPFIGVMLIFLLQSMRHLRHCRLGGKPTGLFLCRAIVLTVSVVFISELVRLPSQILVNTGNLRRARILRQLNNQQGEHLVIVRYSPEHSVHKEWVYNCADIEHAKVIWARDMGEGKNRELLQYFHNRKIWLVQADDSKSALISYGASSGLASHVYKMKPSHAGYGADTTR